MTRNSTAHQVRWVYSDVGALSGNALVHIRDEAQRGWSVPEARSRVSNGRAYYIDGAPRELSKDSHYGRTLCGLTMYAGQWWFIQYDNGYLERCGLCDYLAGRPQ